MNTKRMSTYFANISRMFTQESSEIQSACAIRNIPLEALQRKYASVGIDPSVKKPTPPA